MDKFAIINATEYVKQRQKNIVSGLMEGEITGGSKEAEKFYDSADVEKYEGWVYKIGPWTVYNSSDAVANYAFVYLFTC